MSKNVSLNVVTEQPNQSVSVKETQRKSRDRYVRDLDSVSFVRTWPDNQVSEYKVTYGAWKSIPTDLQIYLALEGVKKRCNEQAADKNKKHERLSYDNLMLLFDEQFGQDVTELFERKSRITAEVKLSKAQQRVAEFSAAVRQAEQEREKATLAAEKNAALVQQLIAMLKASGADTSAFDKVVGE